MRDERKTKPQLIKELCAARRQIAKLQMREEVLRRRHDELERREMERTAALEEANAALRAEVAERQRVEEALRAAEQDYRGIFEHIPIGIYRSSIEGKQIRANPALVKLNGYSSEEEMLPAVNDIATEWYVDPHRRKEFQRVLEQDGSVTNFESEIYRHKTRERIWIAENARLVRAPDGAPLYYEGTVQDITERKRAEEERQKLQAQLFQKQKLEALGTLAGGIAHDFNNILSVISGYTELAAGMAPVGSLAWRNLQRVLESSRRAKALVQQILALSQPSRGGDRVIQLQPLVEETLQFLRASLSKTIDIRCELHCPTETILADPTKLQQVLMNLCVNAAQAIEKNSGILTIGLRQIEISQLQPQTSVMLPPGVYFELMVSDTGCGMPPEVRARIFEPFFTTKAVGEGSGMGLAIVHSVVHSYGGAIAVQSQPGQGSTFSVYLPMHKTALTHGPNAARPPADSSPASALSAYGRKPWKMRRKSSHGADSGYR
jgi:PAS domain S-box-containing protein